MLTNTCVPAVPCEKKNISESGGASSREDFHTAQNLREQTKPRTVRISDRLLHMRIKAKPTPKCPEKKPAQKKHPVASRENRHESHLIRPQADTSRAITPGTSQSKSAEHRITRPVCHQVPPDRFATLDLHSFANYSRATTVANCSERRSVILLPRYPADASSTASSTRYQWRA